MISWVFVPFFSSPNSYRMVFILEWNDQVFALFIQPHHLIREKYLWRRRNYILIPIFFSYIPLLHRIFHLIFSNHRKNSSKKKSQYSVRQIKGQCGNTIKTRNCAKNLRVNNKWGISYVIKKRVSAHKLSVWKCFLSRDVFSFDHEYKKKTYLLFIRKKKSFVYVTVNFLDKFIIRTKKM